VIIAPGLNFSKRFQFLSCSTQNLVVADCQNWSLWHHIDKIDVSTLQLL